MSSVVINDPGGVISDHLVQGIHYAWAGTNLIVKYCASACLDMLDMVPKDHICFKPSAWIGYHSINQRPDGTEDTTTMIWERGKDWIARGYKSCG